MDFDEEKHRLLMGEVPVQPANARKPRNSTRATLDRIQNGVSRLWIVLSVLYCSLLFYNWSSDRWHRRQLSAVRVYEGEQIEWKRCDENDGYELECSSIDVPMDQFSEENSGNKTFSIPLIRIRGKNATKNLLVNPGGPGGSGVEYVYRRGKQMIEVVGGDFHVLGFDPRGINGSRPAALCYQDQETRAKRSSVRAPESFHYSPEVYSWTENFVQACEDTTGEHSKYINTPQTAADMNSILDAVGQEDMYYWGFSYGTVLGQTYAMMYPERSERVIVDGVCNIFDWYDSLLDMNIFADSENALAGFFEKCIEEGDGCPLSSFADSKEELQSTVMGYINNLQKEPAHVYVNSTLYGLITYDTLLSSVFRALHKPPEWFSIAESIANLMRGNGTDALLKYGLHDYFAAEMMDHNAFVTFNDQKAGKEHWPQKEELVKLVEPLVNSSIFGLDLATGFYPMAQWRVPHTHDFKPSHGVKTKHPLLVLSQTYDPITPLMSARVARDAFNGASLLEVEGFGHCSVAIHSSCAVNATRQFLLHGTLPEDNTKCEVDTPYFVSPEKKQEILQKAAMKTASEDDRLWAAQLGMSDGIQLPF